MRDGTGPTTEDTKEFWEQAVQLVLEQKLTIPKAAPAPEHVRQHAQELGGAVRLVRFTYRRTSN